MTCSARNRDRPRACCGREDPARPSRRPAAGTPRPPTAATHAAASSGHLCPSSGSSRRARRLRNAACLPALEAVGGRFGAPRDDAAIILAAVGDESHLARQPIESRRERFERVAKVRRPQAPAARTCRACRRRRAGTCGSTERVRRSHPVNRASRSTARRSLRRRGQARPAPRRSSAPEEQRRRVG